MCDKNKWKPLKVQLETDFSSSQVFLNRGSNKSRLGRAGISENRLEVAVQS